MDENNRRLPPLFGRTRSRRRFILEALATCGAVGIVTRAAAATLFSAPKRSTSVTIENFSAAGTSLGKVELPRVVKTADEWRKQLSPLAYHVTREEGTELAFSGEYDKNHADGLYRCICCDTALYDSRTKFDSGTGWPSFWQPISRANVQEGQDSALGMTRTAVSCHRCDAHLGHVFDDGPRPTGLRYCMNSVALKFVRRA
jgi:peptide-methionine (R)-S-oxide reductase